MLKESKGTSEGVLANRAGQTSGKGDVERQEASTLHVLTVPCQPENTLRS